MKNIIFIAPPAAGKGTASELLVERYGYEHISTGDMLREAIASGSEIGNQVKSIMDQGQLVSDEIVIALLKEKLELIKGKSFILDGFPRTLPQAEELNTIFQEEGIDNYVTIFLDVSEELAMQRSLGRITCSGCGTIFHRYFENKKPKVEGICDNCGAELISRNDDNEESFKKRFETYINNSKAILDYYKDKNKLVVINANRESTESIVDIEKVIND